MPVQIQIRNGTAAQWTSANPTLAAGEVGIENDTRKQKFGDGTTAWNSLAYASGGTVTSVTGTSPVASSGGATPAISLISGYGDTQNPYVSKTANQVLAAPNGTSGVPSFRALVSADIPTLNQNTTGTAAGLSATLAIASGGTGATTAISAFNALAPSQTANSGKYLTTDGTNTSWGTVSGGGTPGGSSGNVQYNNGSGGFAGNSGLTWNGSTLIATSLQAIPGSTQDSIRISGRAGGTNSYELTVVPSTLTGNRTITLPDATGTVYLSGTDLGTPSAGVVTNLTGTASININGTVGATTANTGTFSSTVHKGATSGTVTMTAPAVAGTQSYTLPTALPTSGTQVLASNSSGVMSWVTVSFYAGPTSVEYLVVGGGGAGGPTSSSGGGGAGGLRTNVGGTGLSVTAGTSYSITVGAGGTGLTNTGYTATVVPGNPSSFAASSTINASGGGGGCGGDTVQSPNALSGGSGGGSGGGYVPPPGAGNTGGYTPVEGYAGGTGAANYGSGGGGSGGVGGSVTGAYPTGTAGAGGLATSSSISGSPQSYAGGGGGGVWDAGTTGTGATNAGNGGAVVGTGANGGDAAANFGGGGGGGSGTNAGTAKGGNGGSGVVIIRYPDTFSAATLTTGSPTITVTGGYRIYKWTGNGSITF